MGQKIFNGLQDIFLHLLTPQLSPMKDETVDLLALRQNEEIKAVRSKFENLKRKHLDAKIKDVSYNPDASDYFKFIPNYLKTLAIGETYKIDVPCYKVKKT